MDASIAQPSALLQSTNSDAPTATASALSPGETLNEYLITGIIGEGGFGIVYAARDTLLQRNVAIKEYMPAAIANRLASSQIHLRSARHQKTFEAGMQGFIDEARLLAQFKHPALVEILRFWEANGTAYMVMPHYSGRTLRSLLRQERNLCTESWLKNILAPILDATELLHNNDIYHRDIAPDNIVIQDNGQPVLLDLGSARRVIAGMQSALTVVVKPGYAPIEQYTEDTVNEQGPWTDIYALGAVLYFSITGSAPSASVSRMMRDTLKTLSSTDYPQFSDNFLTAINRALQLRPCDRFQSVAEFRDALNLNTIFTSNITLVSSLSKNANAAAVTDDDEITQILTEEEINQFKEKLLHTLSGTTIINKPQEPLKNPLPETTNKNVNHNILLNDTTPENKSISSFDDVKALLEQKPIPVRKQESTNTLIAHNHTIPAATKAAKPTKVQWPLVLPITIGGVLLTTALLGGIYLLNSTDDMSETRGENSNQAVDTALIPTSAATAEHTAVPQIDYSNPSVTQGNALDTSLAIQTIAPQYPTVSTQQSVALLETDRVANTVTNTDSTKHLISETTPETSTRVEGETTAISNENNVPATRDSNKNNNSTTKQTAQQDNHQAPIANPIEQGIAKVTLLPWGEIWVDNQRYGVSPPVRELSLAPGTYRIELRNSGQPTEVRTISLKQGDNPVIYHNFTAPQQSMHSMAAEKTTNATTNKTNAPQNKQAVVEAKKPQATIETIDQQKAQVITYERTLNIKVLPWGEIFLDGKIAGVTPPLHQLKISPGAHIIEIRHPNYTTKTIQVSASDPLTTTLEHQFK